ncbi:MAG: hypothetical protein WAU65_03145 [Candidatus Nanoarchaeia archaeon]
MKKKSSLVTFLVIVAVIIIAGLIIYLQYANKGSGVSADLAKCIGVNSQIYVQLGCHFCAEQEALFGSSYQYLNSTDCYYNQTLCNNLGIQGTPTWIINGTTYLGVQSIDKLKNLTGC